MKIEAKQIDEAVKKELEINQTKFDKQIDSMNDTLDKKLDGQTQMIVAGKEQMLIMVNEAHEDLLDKKLKVMRSKQFFDLSKQLTALQSRLAMEHMIRKREIDMKFEQEKEGIIQEGITGS